MGRRHAEQAVKDNPITITLFIGTPQEVKLTSGMKQKEVESYLGKPKISAVASE